MKQKKQVTNINVLECQTSPKTNKEVNWKWNLTKRFGAHEALIFPDPGGCWHTLEAG